MNTEKEMPEQTYPKKSSRTRITVSVTNDLVTDQRVHKVCTTLSQNGYNVKLIGRRFRKSKPLERNYKTVRMRLLFVRSAFFYAEYNIRLFLYLLFDKTDMYLSNDTDSLPANYLASMIRRKPLVFDAHEMFPEVPEVTNRKFVKVFWTKIEDWIFPKLKNAYTVCASISEIYNRKYNMNMQVVRNIPPAERPVINQKPIHMQGKRIILYQGAVNMGRGIEWIIDAMPYLDDFVFYVVGDGDILSDLKEKVHALQLNEKVIFTGRIPMEALPAYTACADIGVNLLENQGLNYYYSLPNRIFDYIRQDIPALASDFPEIRKVVAHYDVGVLTNNHDPLFLAEMIRKMLAGEKNNAGFALANAELTWENEAETLLGIVGKAAGKRIASIDTMRKKAKTCIGMIREIDFNLLDISDYNRQYIFRLLPHLNYYFDIYIQTLSILPDFTPSNNKIVDFGGGHGFLSVFLKYLGYEVVYCDINPLSVKTVSLIKEKTGWGPDYILQGSVDELKKFCDSRQFTPHFLIATDLIEHVYDLPAFFQGLRQINSGFEMVFTTGSNPCNPYKCRNLRKAMLKEEEKYFLQRADFIRKNRTGLNEIEVKKIAQLSRGKIYSDILEIIDLYQQTGKFPGSPLDSYNTCDPLTGNWSERILPFEIYRKWAVESGFSISFQPGFYNEFRNRKTVSAIFRLLNCFIKNTNKAGFYPAPYIIIRLLGKNE